MSSSVPAGRDDRGGRRRAAGDPVLGAQAARQRADGVDLEVGPPLVEKVEEAAQAADVGEIRPARSVGGRIDEGELERVRHDGDLGEAEAPRLEEVVLHLGQGDRGDLDVAQAPGAIVEVADGQLPDAGHVGREQRVGLLLASGCNRSCRDTTC